MVRWDLEFQIRRGEWCSSVSQKPAIEYHYFHNLAHARTVIAEWRRDYNEARPHSSLGRMPPAEFAARHRLDTATEQNVI
jgi:transposase InsO family protein